MSFSPINREMLETWLPDKKGTFLSLPFSPAKGEEISFVYYACLHVYVCPYSQMGIQLKHPMPRISKTYIYRNLCF